MTDSDDKDTRKPRTASPFKQGGVQNRLPRRRSIPAFMKESARNAQKKEEQEQSSTHKESPESPQDSSRQSQEGRKRGAERPVVAKPTTKSQESSASSTAHSRASSPVRGQRGTGEQTKQSGTGVKRPVQARRGQQSGNDSPFKAAKPVAKRSGQQTKPVSLPSPGAPENKNTGQKKSVEPRRTRNTQAPKRGSTDNRAKNTSRTVDTKSQGSGLPSLGAESAPNAVPEKSTVGKKNAGHESGVTKEKSSVPALPSLGTGNTAVDVPKDADDDTDVESVVESSFESFLAELTDDESPIVNSVSSDTSTETDDETWLSDEKTQDAGVSEKTGQQVKKTFADHYLGDNKRSKKSGYDKQKIVEKYAKKRLDSNSRERYKHFTEHNKVTGRQIEFFQNLNLAHTYDKHVMADLLKPPAEMTAETREQKALRERLVRQALGGEEALKRGSRLRISPKDIEVMRFLARFQYATARHIARIYAETEGASQRRLNRLRERGLVLSNYFYGAKTIYWLTEEGMLLSGYDYKVLHQEKDINLQSFPHRFGLNHLAANIMGANVNVLDLDDFPQKNRESLVDGSMIEGETLVSEYEIHSTLARKRGNMRGEIYKPQIISENRIALREWAKRKRDGLSDDENPPPEFMHGNEYMFALYPREVHELVHHIPDLVVKRPRDPKTGAPRSIAVELELNVKRDKESYKRTMLAYKSEDMTFQEVVWVSPEKDIRTVLERAADEAGLTDTGRVRILPLYVEDGIFVNMNMWQL